MTSIRERNKRLILRAASEEFADKGFACSTYRPSKATHDFTDAMRRQILRLLPAADRDNPK